MAAGHPVDEHGRALPDSAWPADRQAPGSLELVRRFCNTTSLESGADRLETAAGFASWLAEQGRPIVRAGPADRARCSEAREALRDALTAHRDHPDHPEHPDGLRQFRRLTDSIRFRVAPGTAEFEMIVLPEHCDVDRFLGELVLAVLAAHGAGTWERLKPCRSCRWVVYDASKNRSAQWCSMSACGGRSKVRAPAHRARRSTEGR